MENFIFKQWNFWVNFILTINLQSRRNEKKSGKVGSYQEMLLKLNRWLTRLFNWNRFKCPEILNTAQEMKFSIKDFFSKCDQIRQKLRIWSDLLKKSLMGNFIFCAV